MSILQGFDHIGIVVEDLEKAVKELSYFLGLDCQEQMDITDAGIRIAFYPLGPGQMEIIEFQKPMDDVDPVVLQPRAGVQHVAFRVADFDKALEELTKRGLKVVRGFPRQGARGKVAFFYPTEGLDLLIEICETHDSPI